MAPPFLRLRVDAHPLLLLLTRRSFRPHPAVKVLLPLPGSTALEGPSLEWAATHLKHHAHADQEDDP